MKKDSMNRPIYVNKKIEALLNSVGSLGYDRHHTGKWILSDIEIQKFAELIVRECMRLNSKELSFTAIERLLPLYQEHFGVEE